MVHSFPTRRSSDLSALAIVAGGRAETLREGIAVAEACIDEGGARRKLQGLIEMSNS